MAIAVDDCFFIPDDPSNDAPTAFPIGVTTVTWSAVDFFGPNTGTCTQLVTVLDDTVDTIPPVLDCPNQFFAFADPGTCGAFLIINVTATDDSGGEVTIDNLAENGFTFGLGSTTLYILATDPSGNSSICTIDVIIVDDICLLYTSPSPRDKRQSRMPSSA